MPALLKYFGFLLTLFIFWAALITPVFAVSDPRAVANNKVGINNLSAEANIDHISALVNTNGDWGYVVIIIKKDQRDFARWENVFNTFNKSHLIPIVRLATSSDSNGNWQRPTEEDARDWAEFLNKLPWPVENRYVQVYNEVNHANEWGGNVDAADYAKELNKTIDALKAKSPQFFVLNSPLDLALATTDSSLDASVFLATMGAIDPELFKKLDGWASHSYPNPGFAASPSKVGRLGINAYNWELAQIAGFVGVHNLPVFITETGWKQSGSLGEKTIADFYKTAFAGAWSNKDVVAVAPFVFDYSEPLFSAFSFKNGDKFTKSYDAVRDMQKVKGEPVRDNTAEVDIKKPGVLITNLGNRIQIKIKNTGNYIWNTDSGLKVTFTGDKIASEPVKWSKKEVYPQQEVDAVIPVKSTEKGLWNYSIKVLDGDTNFADEASSIKSESYLSLILDGLKSIL